MPEVVRSVLKVLNEIPGGQPDAEIFEMVLDIWDELYQREEHQVCHLSSMLNNVE